jgi:AcrR family transcriptional regulator
MTARPARRSAPPPTGAGLSRDRICREALALVDDEGLAALSMRRLGARLGVEAMSLYRYVRDKDDLLDAIHAAILGELGALRGTDDSWRGLLDRMATGFRRSLMRHPNALPLFGTRPIRAGEATSTIERVGAALVAAGFTPRAAEQTLKVVGLYTIGYALGDAHHPDDDDGRPRLEAFQFGLDALLEGLAVHARVQGQAPPKAPPRRSRTARPVQPAKTARRR